MGSSRETEKALRYIGQLDEARCAGRWKDIPELCRKVEKHAPHRKCLTLTARSEVQIAAYSVQRPSTAASTVSNGLSKSIPALLTAIDEEGDHVQDAFQATVCLGWLHYVLEEPGLAVARLPKDFSDVALRLSEKESTLSGWTRVCIVKGAFLKGSSQEKTAAAGDAIQTYSSILPWLSSLKSLEAESAQFKMWMESLLVRLCLLSDLSSTPADDIEPMEVLQSYRFWARYWSTVAKQAGLEGEYGARARRLAWKAYYDTLSIILRDDLPYMPETAAVEAQATSGAEKQTPNVRLQQRSELKRVEAVYEGLLLKETRFPKASESNGEIETWTDAVMDNWRLLCGPTWTDTDLGEGGKEAVGRGVLDILYRAATKTFHSTQILRHLFTVHASLAEFELAFKAYDAYIEIISRGKDRTAKTGEEDVGLDSDSTILRTSAEAIRILCRFGARLEAEKALTISTKIEKWLEQMLHTQTALNEAGHGAPIEPAVSRRALSLGYSAIGISQAQWARFTYNAEDRSSIQTKAILNLRKALDPTLNNSDDLEALYALGLILAETRDIPGAIKIVKRALSPVTKNNTSISADGVVSNGFATEYGRERKLIPFWHLLALLLTTRSDFTSAERSCEAAFEQFGDPTIVFGKDEEDDTFRSEHLNEATGKSSRSSGIVDRMESYEKTGIISMKMTQLSLLDVIEGSTIAVDGSDELLGLYARLFGDPAADTIRTKAPVTAMLPPKSAVGTIRGSIFRSKGSIKSSGREPTARNSSIASSHPSTAVTQPIRAPAIQVTHEDGTTQANGHHHHHHLFHHHGHEEERPGVTRSTSKLKKRSSNSLHRRSERQNEGIPDVPSIPSSITNDTSAYNSPVRKSVESPDQPLRPIAHNMPPSSEPPPAGHKNQPPKQDVRLPAPFPNANYISSDPRFSTIQNRRHRVTVLVNIWVFISGLYTRAELYEDAKGAVNEALKLVETFEAEIALESSSSKAFADKGWGGGKSIEELWADVYTARGELLVAQAMKHDARSDFERALLHYPDHPEAIVGLCNILLDIHSQVIPLEPNKNAAAERRLSPQPVPCTAAITQESKKEASTPERSKDSQVSPPELSRLAARDRAYGLLSTLTKLGAGWDYSEAWYALARAYEESGQMEKTKEVLWWCVELEDTHPIRHWRDVALGGFVL